MRRPGDVAALALVAWCGCGGAGATRRDAGDGPQMDAAGASEPADTAVIDAIVATEVPPDLADAAPSDVSRPVGTPWGAPVAIDKIPAGNAHGTVAIQTDPTGHAISVWLHSNAAGGILSVEANRFDPATRDWSLPITLEATELTSASDPDLAVGPAGDAIAVWLQESNDVASVWSNWYEASSQTWHDAVLVERDDTGEAQEPHVAALPDGGAVAVWHQWDGLRTSLWANRFVGGKWTGRALLETTDSANANQADVAADSKGNAVAVWRQVDDTQETVWSATRAANADAWNAPFMLGPAGVNDGGNSPQPHVALDASGDGLAVWSLRQETTWSIWSSCYHAGTDTWDPGVLVESDDGGDATHPQLAFDASGTAFATWRLNDGVSASIWASRFVTRTGRWTDPARLDDSDTPPVSPMVAAGGEGHAVVVWQQQGVFSNDVHASRFDPLSGLWEIPSRLDMVNALAETPRVAVDAAGNALVIWAQPQQGGWADLLLAYHPF
jgi:hypothetical protein